MHARSANARMHARKHARTHAHSLSFTNAVMKCLHGTLCMKYSQMAGGSALNVAVDLGELMKGRAGAQCEFLGLVGDDEFGAFLRRRLVAGGVLDRMETAAGKSTGCCIVLSGAEDRGFVTE